MPRRSIHISETLAEALELRWKALGYPSFNAYLKGLIRYDMIVNGEHTITRELADAPSHVQDRIDAKCLACCQGGTRERGSLLRKMIHDIVGEAGDKSAVEKELPRKALE